MKTWRVPVVLWLITACGLLFALLGDGGWDVVSWILLAIPVVVALFYSLNRTKVQQK